jgi:hypothetical protein
VSNLPERQGESRTVEILREARWPLIAASCAALSYGALSIFGGFGGAVLAPGQSGPGNPGGGAPPAGAPNAPTTLATVYRTEGDSLWIDLGTYVGSGGDAQDSAYILVDTSGGNFSAPQYFADTLGAIRRDSIAADSGAVVDIITGYKGTSGGWSAPDTLLGVEMTFASSLYPNEPAGMTTVYNNPGIYDELEGDFTDNTDGWFDHEPFAPAAQIVSDPGNPTGTGTSVRFDHLNGDGGGGGKLRTWDRLSDTLGGSNASGPFDTLYYALRLYIPTGQGNGCGPDTHPAKANYLGVEGNGFNRIYFVPCTGEQVVQFAGAPGTQSRYVSYSFPNTEETEWLLEVVLTAESSATGNDATMATFVNGSPIAAGVWTGLTLSADGQSAFRFDGMNWYHDQGSNATTGHFWYMRDVKVSGK